MLNGGGGLNPDGLSLDLQFAADKTLTARRGPTPDFTRGSTGTFVGSNGLIQSAAINEPRFDHNTTSPFACRGLLIEESRTNLCLRSEEFDNATWAKSNSSASAPVVTANQVNSPAGVLSADQIAFPSVTAGFSIVVQTFSQAAGVVYTASVYLRGLNGGEKVWWSWTPNGTTYARKECLLTTSWQRFDFTYTSTLGSNYLQLGVDLRDTSQTAQSAQTIYAWGVQLEAGSFPTSYIPTTTGTLARSADVCSITGGDFNRFYNSTSGTLLSEASISNLIGNNRGIVQVDNGTNESILRHVYGLAEGGFRSIIRAGGDAPTVLSTILGTASTIQKRIIAYEGTSFASVTNGGAVATATRTMPTGLSAMKIGNLAESSFYLSGHIAAIRFYKKRLPNAKLQALTV